GVLLGLSALAAAAPASAATPQDDVRTANALVRQALAAARQGDVVAAHAAYADYENTWFEIEDGVRATSRDAYRAIEKAMSEVAAAFAPAQSDPARVVHALAALDREQQAFIGGAASNPTVQQVGATRPSMSTLLSQLGDAQAALGRADYPAGGS